MLKTEMLKGEGCCVMRVACSELRQRNHHEVRNTQHATRNTIFNL